MSNSKTIDLSDHEEAQAVTAESTPAVAAASTILSGHTHDIEAKKKTRRECDHRSQSPPPPTPERVVWVRENECKSRSEECIKCTALRRDSPLGGAFLAHVPFVLLF